MAARLEAAPFHNPNANLPALLPRDPCLPRDLTSGGLARLAKNAGGMTV